ncbi:sodium/potassium/calcium exchanger 1-like [Morone saxatilis]|uniref:sodium/potassium/calcium exchanger 1-like n=1 Tax=Morone saxatilis TaxID=34816 RepID=UPI0015E25054|nr:sodium/potassium/calcium exchanger 1-like [Morone saxatilis]
MGKAALSQGHILTPEKTAPDQISISPKMEKQRNHNNPPPRQPANGGANSEEEDEDEYEEEGIQIYMDRPAELSSGQSSCKDSGDSSGNRPLAASGDSEVSETVAAFEGLDQHAANAEGEEVSLIPEGGQTAVQGHVTVEVVEEEEEEEEEEVMFDSSGNVNLFSVTLAALDAREEEDKENTTGSLTDFLKLSDLEPLLATDSQADSDDQTAVALKLPTQEDFSETGYEGRRVDTLSGCLRTCDGEMQHEEEEEEEREEEGRCRSLMVVYHS